MSLKFERLGDLDCLVQRNPQSQASVVLLHGYGADFTDLAGLVPMISLPEDVNWVFPNAPLPLPEQFGSSGRAWFPIDVMALERAMQTGSRRYFADQKSAGLDKAVDAVIACLKASELPFESMALGGFSQGAMIASHAALGHQLPIPLLLQLSGTLIGHGLIKPSPASQNMSVFQSHGVQDPVLPYSAAEELKVHLETLCQSVDFYGFTGGHEIPRPLLAKLASKIQDNVLRNEPKNSHKQPGMNP
ncbi:MAG: esterase [Pseudobacteriovorax sp.]|nr:esterase [Pseudobacteriovorax sp.]